MPKLKLFFSWQSDIKGNHEKIKEALKNACNIIRTEGYYDIIYDESTWNRSGSPIIESTVVEKVMNCDLFVADVTPIGSLGKKEVPNPNVMYELGIAKSNLVDESILMLYIGDIDTTSMPFDINHHRMSRFSKKNITEYIRQMAENAVKNPRHYSLFDEPDNELFIHYDNNVQKNISSGKYLPNVFFDNLHVKQHLRDFVAPYPFAKLLLERCDRIETYPINRKRQSQHTTSFEFDIASFKSFVAEETICEFYKGAKQLEDYLIEKYNEVSNLGSSFLVDMRKYERLVSHIRHVSSKLLLITTSAGQGKTNQICDLVSNVLLKRRIPYVYLNGYEIDGNNIFGSFASSMLPGTNMSFDDVIRNVDIYCKYKRSPIILIIDGLNENPVPDVFCRNLVVFVEKVLKYEYVKVILTCRSEYYKEFFTDFDNAFKNCMLKIDNLNRYLEEEKKQRLLQKYLQYFNINADIADNVREDLCDDLLMLRIFCEANKNKSLGTVHSINKEAVFAEYYEKMKSNLIEKTYNEEHYKLEPNSVDKIISCILKYMINNNTLFNVPLMEILQSIPSQEKRIFNRFLDENILLRKDLTPDRKGPFSRNEVVNFTYDSFRDYLISTYLLDVVEPNNYSSFERLVTEYTKKGHQLREGVPPFIFVHSRTSKNDRVIKFITTLDWYNEIFELYIWDINDVLITHDDLSLVNSILASEFPKYMARRLVYYGRWNCELYPNLNIRILLKYLSKLNDNELEDFLERSWNITVNKYHIYRKEKSERTIFLESIKKLLDHESFIQYKEFHNIYELLLYFIPFSSNMAESIFVEYQNKFNNTSMLERVASECNSEKLKLTINQMKIK